MNDFNPRTNIVKDEEGYLFTDSHHMARSHYLEGPATGHLDIGFSWFPCL